MRLLHAILHFSKPSRLLINAVLWCSCVFFFLSFSNSFLCALWCSIQVIVHACDCVKLLTCNYPCACACACAYVFAHKFFVKLLTCNYPCACACACAYVYAHKLTFLQVRYQKMRAFFMYMYMYIHVHVAVAKPIKSCPGTCTCICDLPHFRHRWSPSCHGDLYCSPPVSVET